MAGLQAVLMAYARSIWNDKTVDAVRPSHAHGKLTAAEKIADSHDCPIL